MSFYTKEKQYCANFNAILFSLLNLKYTLEYKVRFINILCYIADLYEHKYIYIGYLLWRKKRYDSYSHNIEIQMYSIQCLVKHSLSFPFTVVPFSRAPFTRFSLRNNSILNKDMDNTWWAQNTFLGLHNDLLWK